jgi:hypothetical protein
LLRKLVCTNRFLTGNKTLLRRKVTSYTTFDTGLKTLLETLLEFGEFPPRRDYPAGKLVFFVGTLCMRVTFQYCSHFSEPAIKFVAARRFMDQSYISHVTCNPFLSQLSHWPPPPPLQPPPPPPPPPPPLPPPPQKEAAAPAATIVFGAAFDSYCDSTVKSHADLVDIYQFTHLFSHSR